MSKIDENGPLYFIFRFDVSESAAAEIKEACDKMKDPVVGPFIDLDGGNVQMALGVSVERLKEHAGEEANDDDGNT